VNVAPISHSSIQPPPPGAPRDAMPAARLASGTLSASALRHAPAAEQRAAVGAQFEAILIRQLLGKTMTSMLGSGEGAAAAVYGDLLADNFARQLAAGRGLGLGRLIEAQLTPRAEAPPPPAPLSP
jgi:Rod binding domain-containing protein